MVLGQSWSAAMRPSTQVAVLRKCDARSSKRDEVLNERTLARSTGGSNGRCQRLGGLDFSRYDGGPLSQFQKLFNVQAINYQEESTKYRMARNVPL